LFEKQELAVASVLNWQLREKQQLTKQILKPQFSDN